MKIQHLFIEPYQTTFKNGRPRFGGFLVAEDEMGRQGLGEVAPLPKWSGESLEEALTQFDQLKKTILQKEWTEENCLLDLGKLDLLPSLAFGLECALFSLFCPVSDYSIPASALFMGSLEEILEQANQRSKEGFRSAKLKVSELTFEEAAQTINVLKEQFSLRVDVNRAWSTDDSLDFFSQFPLDTFDYVEEPFKNPYDLRQFPHPLAVDESFPEHLSLEQLELLPTLKALIYKPTIQGGLVKAAFLNEWAQKRKIAFVLSSCFETGIGLRGIASIANRLSLKAPIGIGTYHFMNEVFSTPLLFSENQVKISPLTFVFDRKSSYRQEVRRLVETINPFDELENEHKQAVITWIDSGVELCRLKTPITPPQHLVAYFVLIDIEKECLLLVNHKKAGLWLPSGGHVEPGEHPTDTAFRELKEELGVDLRLLLSGPIFLTVSRTVGSFSHLDVNLWYVFEADLTKHYNYDSEEFYGIGWYSFWELPQNIDPHLKRFCQKFQMIRK